MRIIIDGRIGLFGFNMYTYIHTYIQFDYFELANNSCYSSSDYHDFTVTVYIYATGIPHVKDILCK